MQGLSRFSVTFDSTSSDVKEEFSRQSEYCQIPTLLLCCSVSYVSGTAELLIFFYLHHPTLQNTITRQEHTTKFRDGGIVGNSTD